MTTDNLEPLVYSINEVRHLTSLSKTRIYELIKSRELKVTKCGYRTLVHADSLRALLRLDD